MVGNSLSRIEPNLLSLLPQKWNHKCSLAGRRGEDRARELSALRGKTTRDQDLRRCFWFPMRQRCRGLPLQSFASAEPLTVARRQGRLRLGGLVGHGLLTSHNSSASSRFHETGWFGGFVSKSTQSNVPSKHVRCSLLVVRERTLVCVHARRAVRRPSDHPC